MLGSKKPIQTFMTCPIKNLQLLFVQAAVNQEPETGVEKPEVEVAVEKLEEVTISWL